MVTAFALVVDKKISWPVESIRGRQVSRPRPSCAPSIESAFGKLPSWSNPTARIEIDFPERKRKLDSLFCKIVFGQTLSSCSFSLKGLATRKSGISPRMASSHGWPSSMDMNSPFQHEHWIIAGSTENGTVYLVSKHETRIFLWSYNTITKRFARLSYSGDLLFLNSTYNGNIVASFDGRRGLVDVFVRSQELPALLVRFLLGQSSSTTNRGGGCKPIILKLTNPLPFRMTYGKNGLFHFGDALIFVASERACPYAPFRLRLIYIETHTEYRAFHCTQMWTSDTVGEEVREVLQVGNDRLLIMIADRVLVFEPRLFGSPRWDDSILSTSWPSSANDAPSPPPPWTRANHRAYLGSCSGPAGVDTDRFWAMTTNAWTEVCVTPIGQLLITRTIDFTSSPTNDDGQQQQQRMIETSGVASSSSHLFTFERYVPSYCARWSSDRIFSKPISPPSLQYICLDRLSAALPDFPKYVATEQKAAQFGIAAPAWRNFCR